FLASPYAPSLFRTTGVSNIEDRWAAGGGGRNHTPGAGTKLGARHEVTGNQLETKGMGTPHHQEKIGEQKPEGSKFDKAWNKSMYGAEKGK
ncbi:MAG: hypothetical protein LQ349_007224, partial [Xanthoria aureola]